MELKKILVTGGCGFIGGNFLHFVLEKYPDLSVVNLDKLTYCGRKESLSDVENNGRYSFVHGDIANEKDVEKAMNGCDGVVNFAAESHVDNSIKNPAVFAETNVKGTMVLLNQAGKQGIERFVQIGTDEVYGSVEKGSSSESDALKPRNPYSATKAASDLLALSYHNTFGLNVSVTRSSNNYGPYQFPEKVIPLFITNILRGKKVPLYGPGKNVRDWLFVKDNCEAVDLVLRKGKAGEIYNIGADNKTTNIELTRKILSLLGRGEEMIERVQDRPGHDLRYSVGFSKIKNELGWKPKKPFEEGLKETVEWYKANEKWWKPLIK
ncbi:MAG: dTDP-glucose 4,6-dehydratase [Candidatus Diapherotrites archaeon]|nr:dTDP-glucose 4,6-dehydratase [Candidatus Diapherotrites archaeon]